MSQNFTARVIERSVLQAPSPTDEAQMLEQGFTEQDWRRLLISLGENPDRAGLVETPSRVAKAWKDWTSGYAKDPAECLNSAFLWQRHDRLCSQRKNSRLVKADAPGRLLCASIASARATHDPDCQCLDDSSGTASRWRSHSLSPPVHRKSRHSHPGRGNRHLIHARHTAIKPRTARGIFRCGACGVISFV